MATNIPLTTSAWAPTKDPLAGLSPVKIVNVPGPETDEDLPFTEPFIDHESLIPAMEAFGRASDAAKEAIEELRKVVQCYECGNHAFDGTLTAFETDEGPQPFCHSCVAAIEERSAWQEETALPMNPPFYGGWWQVPNDITVPPPNQYLTWNGTDTTWNTLAVSGDVLAAGGSAGANWVDASHTHGLN